MRNIRVIVAALLAGGAILPARAQSPGPSPSANQVNARSADDPVVARINDFTITQSQIVRPLLEGYGLNVLLNVATLELAEQEAESRKLSVSQADIDAEQSQTLAKMFGDARKEDYPQLLEQFLSQQRISKPEFEIVLQTNAYLRKIAEPLVKQSITDDRMQESFKALYGETVQVRHIQCANLQEIAEAKRKLASGETFEQVARELSRNKQTAPTGGYIPPFSRYATGYPNEFKDVAFALKVGDVSDPVQVEDGYNLIKLEKRMEPKAVKYDDVKQSLREDLIDRLTQSQIKNLRAQLVNRIGAKMTVEDPTLARQYELKKTQSETTVHGKQEALDAIKRDERRAAEKAQTPAVRAPTLQSPAMSAAPLSAPGVSTTPPSDSATSAPAMSAPEKFAPENSPPGATVSPAASAPAAPAQGLRPPATRPGDSSPGAPTTNP